MKFNEVRIIGGKWRGRKLKFPAIEQLRPTPDRIRETLFNWLSPFILDAHCLDLFAGSGALGLEALSRGALSAVFFDNNPLIIKYLKEQFSILQSLNAKVIRAKIPECSVSEHLGVDKINLIFLDPPFHQNMIKICTNWLEKQPWLAPNALIYLEAESTLHPLPIPENWEILRSKTAGQVGYHLLQRQSMGSSLDI